jgi:hypothetical protein
MIPPVKKRCSFHSRLAAPKCVSRHHDPRARTRSLDLCIQVRSCVAQSQPTRNFRRYCSGVASARPNRKQNVMGLRPVNSGVYWRGEEISQKRLREHTKIHNRLTEIRRSGGEAVEDCLKWNGRRFTTRGLTGLICAQQFLERRTNYRGFCRATDFGIEHAAARKKAQVIPALTYRASPPKIDVCLYRERCD